MVRYLFVLLETTRSRRCASHNSIHSEAKGRADQMALLIVLLEIRRSTVERAPKSTCGRTWNSGTPACVNKPDKKRHRPFGRCVGAPGRRSVNFDEAGCACPTADIVIHASVAVYSSSSSSSYSLMSLIF